MTMSHEEIAKLERVLDDLSTGLLIGESDTEDFQKNLKALIQLLLSYSSLAAVRAELQANANDKAKKKESIESSRFSEMLEQVRAVVRNNGQSLKQEAIQGCSSELRVDVDQSLLVEFIERHIQGIEEFEAELLEAVTSGVVDLDPSAEEAQQAARSINRYIHTLKGDAGSVGIIGIERACHRLEDLLVESGPLAAIDPMLSFCKWVSGCIDAFSAGSCPAEKSSSFMERLAKEFEACSSVSCDEPVASSNQDTGLPEYANLDLLAELMGETESAKPEEEDMDQSYQMEGEPELVAEFIAEAEDHLATVEVTLLESSADLNKDSIDKIFRAAHSLKGASAYFKLDEIRESSHLTEDILDEVRSGKRSCDQGLISLLLAYKDLELELLVAVRAAISSGGLLKRNAATKAYIASLKNYRATGSVGAIEKLAPSISQIKPESAPAKKETADGKEKLDIKTFVKVETQRLDQLIDSIGEMVIYSSMLIQSCREQMSSNEEIRKITHQVEKFSRDLQGIGMSMRLIPIRGLFQKLSRLVWDTSKKIGKDIKFTMDGEDTELDRNIIDQLADPLMHMVRNSLDHGVESPDEREKNGKPRQGSVTLSASHSGGCIQIRITDDGRGLDPQKLVAKAIEKGVIAPGQQLTTSEAQALIFAPGFSTAAAVTDISGRGVGMDVVRRNIEAMHGQIHIESEVGKGTVFTIELPLTLAIIDGLLVSVGSERFLLPTLSTIELIKANSGDIVRAFDKAETFMFRGKYLPLYRLSRLFNISDGATNIEDGTVVVVESTKGYSALFLDNVLGCYSTVIKNISDCFKDKRGIAGCAIMPDGAAALILDVRSLVSVAIEEYSFGPGNNNVEIHAA